MSQYVHNMPSSSNIQTRGPKLVDSAFHLKNSTFGRSNRTHVPRMEPEDIGHKPNGSRDDEYYHDESDEPRPYQRRGRYEDRHYSTIYLEDTKAILETKYMTKKVTVDVPDFDGSHDPNAFVDWLDRLED